MQDLFWQLKDTDSFTVYTTLVFVAVVFWFIREIIGSSGLALVSVPFLAFGGILGRAFFAHEILTLSYDKNIDVVMTTASGVLASLIVVLVCKWLWTVADEHRVSRTKLIAIPTRSPRIRR
jgi:hypothetical protein